MTHGDYAEENSAEILGPEEVHGQAFDSPSQDDGTQGNDAEEDDRPEEDHRPEEVDR